MVDPLGTSNNIDLFKRESNWERKNAKATIIIETKNNEAPKKNNPFFSEKALN